MTGIGLSLRRLTAAAGWALWAMAINAAWAGAELPTAPVRNVAEVFFGTSVDDPYRYFEDTKAPKVAEWMKAHSDYAHDLLKSISGRDELRARLESLDSATTARVRGVVRLRGEIYFYQKRGARDDQFKLYMRQGVAGAEKLLFDPEVLKKETGNAHAVNYFTPSPDGKLVALGVSASGSEEASLRVLDTATGAQLGPEISRAQFGMVSWAPDGKELYFNRLQELKDGMAATEKYQRSSAVVMAPGASEQSIRTILQAGVPGEVKIPATEFAAIDVQPDGRVIAIIIDGVSPQFRAYHSTLVKLRAGKPGWQQLFDSDDGVTALAVQGERAYVLSYQDAPRYRLLGGRLDGFSMASAKVLVPESQRVITGIGAAADGLYVVVREGNVKRLLRMAYQDGAVLSEVQLPVLGSVSVSSTADVPGAVVELESWTRARQIYLVAPDGKVTNTGVQPAGPYDAPSDTVATEVMVRSHDGVMIPLSIIHKKNVVLDGNNPTILYGYASYGITEEPFFSLSLLAWMETGGVFAVANPRGSGVFGKQWHEDGKQATKPNSWLDFIASAEYLVAQKWTRPARLAIWGGSAGGILVGRAMTERPDLFAVVIPAVGALDLVRAETTPNGVPNIPEFGSRATEPGFRALLAMSTYHHIKDGVRYPAVLLTHGANDPRVEVWNSTKTAARLLAASSSGKPIVLRLDYDSGHGIGNTKSQSLDERADTFAFALWQMGVAGYSPKGK